MAPDNFKNLGLIFNEDEEKSKTTTGDTSQETGKKN